jgi:basic region leucine zipper protein
MSSSSPLQANNSNENHQYPDTATSSSSSSSSFSTSSSCSSPDIQQKEYVLLNNKSRRKKRAFIPDDKKDPIYWSQRSKNNLSAKRSRVKRRMNDLVLETKVTQLNNENQILRAKIDMLSRKFGHLTNTEDGEGEELEKLNQNKSEETQILNLLDQSSKPNSTEKQTLFEKITTTVSSPMPIKWRYKLFNTSSNS